MLTLFCGCSCSNSNDNVLCLFSAFICREQTRLDVVSGGGLEGAGKWVQIYNERASENTPPVGLQHMKAGRPCHHDLHIVARCELVQGRHQTRSILVLDHWPAATNTVTPSSSSSSSYSLIQETVKLQLLFNCYNMALISASMNIKIVNVNGSNAIGSLGDFEQNALRHWQPM